MTTTTTVNPFKCSACGRARALESPCLSCNHEPPRTMWRCEFCEAVTSADNPPSQCGGCGRDMPWRLVESVANHPTEIPNSCDSNPLNDQVGGDYYRTMAVQPVEYIHRNGLGFIEGSIVKYVSRWRAKGKVEDLRKARHFLDILISMEEQAK